MVTSVPIGKIIRKARRDRELSQAEVGEVIDSSQTLVSFYEDGARPIPKDKAKKLSELLDIPIEMFYTEDIA